MSSLCMVYSGFPPRAANRALFCPRVLLDARLSKPPLPFRPPGRLQACSKAAFVQPNDLISNASSFRIAGRIPSRHREPLAAILTRFHMRAVPSCGGKGDRVVVVVVVVVLNIEGHLIGRWIIVGALAVSCVVYGAVGVAVYATFGPATEDDLTKNFRKDDGLLVLVRATMAVAICATFPLVMMAARNAAYDLFLRPRGVQMTAAVRLSVTSVIVVVCLGTAEIVGSLGVVLDFNGALFGTPVSYIWPMAMYLALPRSRQRRRWRCRQRRALSGASSAAVAAAEAADAAAC
ncbi:unnamed protein product [Prorocentrum cordatum]|uniref:Amino acid transporter transmembrane domain-containing protein n=1 Tax=Prorocentrum cordatum TaxID=2364126 RepID=A0ABN9QY18_9DINO|nr:unnamed protein product [Polarella glacialis]